MTSGGGKDCVSVPFTSGSSLQRDGTVLAVGSYTTFQFPLHRDPRCNSKVSFTPSPTPMFQFPLHRDPRCNRRLRLLVHTYTSFQFPLHRDPRCNDYHPDRPTQALRFSSLYIGILAATFRSGVVFDVCPLFQFPLHRDPRCNIHPL